MKKVCAGICALLLALTVSIGIAGCKSDFQPTDRSDVKIVYLGDSIAEAVLGPSPINEREYYGYYALVGRINGYTYINRSVSGHQTKQFLEYLNRSDSDSISPVVATNTHIREADVIHVSILGNDLLQNSVFGLLKEAVLEANAQKNGQTYVPEKRKAILDQSAVNIAAIVQRLRELNPDALLLFQTVYNPIYEDTAMLNEENRQDLHDLGCEPSQYREYGYKLISQLNDVLRNYLSAHPGAFEIVDAYARFDEIHRQDPQRGHGLIYPDGVHPSNEGHAVMAELITKKLIEHDLADEPSAVARYKALRTEQLDRLFAQQDLSAVKDAIQRATTCEQVTYAYFRAIANWMPDYAKGVGR